MYRCPSLRDMRVPAPQIDRSLLLAIPLFVRMNAAQFDSVLAEASVRRYPLGQPVFEQGAPATAFYVLLSGRLKVTQVTTDGQQVIVRMVNPGDLFGIARALSRPDYPGTASAAEDSIALSWPMEIWDQFMGQQRGLDNLARVFGIHSSGSSSSCSSSAGCSSRRASVSSTSVALPSITRDRDGSTARTWIGA